MNWKKRTISLLLTGCMAVSVLPTVSFAADSMHIQQMTVNRGTCGENLSWELDDAGTLTISGTGEMTAYSTSSAAPWNEYADSVEAVVIETGVTSIGTYAFYNLADLTSVSIADSVTAAGNYCFKGCTSLKQVELGGGLTRLSTYMFSGCTALERIDIPGNVTVIGGSVFWNCSALKEVAFENGLEQIGNGAFTECSMEKLIIPHTVNHVYGTAFWDSENLSEIYFCGEAPTFGANAFKGITATVYYPANKDGWESAIENQYSGKITWVSWEPCTDAHTGNPEFIWTKDRDSCSAEFECLACGKKQSVSCGVTNETTAEATCTENGKMLCTAKVALADGVHTDTVMADIPAVGHTEETDAAVAATCTADGKTEGAHCSVCGEILRAQEIITANGHSWNDGEVTKKPAVGEKGIKTYTCTVCGQTKTEEIEALTPVYEIFKDVSKDSWYVPYVQYVYDNGLMTGVSGDMFQPDRELSRAMIAQILYSHAGKPEVSGEQAFTDVKPGAWYYDAVQWASQNSVVSGVGGGKFQPNANVTREQLAVMLYAHAGKPEVSVSLNSFADQERVSFWAVTAIGWAYENGMITGIEKNGEMYLAPKGNATRAQTAVMLMQYLK